MYQSRTSIFVSAALFTLAACAQPSPAPIPAEPIYNKYGDVVGYAGKCREADVPVTSATQGLPICRPPGSECPPGQQPAATAATAPNQCVPVDRGNDPNSGRVPGTPNNPNGTAPFG